MDEITIYKFEPVLGLSSASVFCIKLETYMKMRDLAYSQKVVADPGQAPLKKLPYITMGQQTLADSGVIIEQLETQQGLDRALNERQRAEAVLLQRTLEEHLYFVLAYSLWGDPQFWPAFRKARFASLPFWLRPLIASLVRRSVQKALYIQGTGRHKREQIYAMGHKDILALSQLLGERQYMLGDEASSVDAVAYAFLASILIPGLSTPLLDSVKACDNLVRYQERMQEQYWN